MAQPKYYTFSPDYLRDFASQVFMQFGVPEKDAVQASAVLSKADVRGIDSHGVARLRTYVDMFKIGRINPTPNIKIIREKKSVATVDGDRGLGLVVGPKANEIAMEKASKFGSGWVSVCNTNHYGIASYYSLKALERDMIGW
jgi:L-2-hydroxycarboxylate dehydrogenase (NAD+)